MQIMICPCQLIYKPESTIDIYCLEMVLQMFKPAYYTILIGIFFHHGVVLLVLCKFFFLSWSASSLLAQCDMKVLKNCQHILEL